MNWLNECSNDSAFPEELVENSGALKIHQNGLTQHHYVQIHSHGKVNENLASRVKSSSTDAPSFTYLQPRVPPHLPHGPIGFSKLEVDLCMPVFIPLLYIISEWGQDHPLQWLYMTRFGSTIAQQCPITLAWMKRISPKAAVGNLNMLFGPLN